MTDNDRNSIELGVLYRSLGTLSSLLQELADIDTDKMSPNVLLTTSESYMAVRSNIRIGLPERMENELEIIAKEVSDEDDLSTARIKIALLTGWINGTIQSVTMFGTPLPKMPDTEGIFEKAKSKHQAHQDGSGQYL